MPDWFYAEGVDHEQAHYLTRLEEIHLEEPVIWAMILHKSTAHTIAKHIAWPITWVLGTLRRLKQEGLVWDSEGRRQVTWDFAVNCEYTELREWVGRNWMPGGIFHPTSSNRNDD